MKSAYRYRFKAFMEEDMYVSKGFYLGLVCHFHLELQLSDYPNLGH